MNSGDSSQAGQAAAAVAVAAAAAAASGTQAVADSALTGAEQSDNDSAVGQFDDSLDDPTALAAADSAPAATTSGRRAYSRPAWYESAADSDAAQWQPWQQHLVVFPSRPGFQPIGGGSGDGESSLVVAFSPPLYKQRYSAVFDLIVDRFGGDPRRPGTVKLVDLGAAECRLFAQSLKFLQFSVDYLAVDCVADADPLMLDAARRSLAPSVGDYVSKRSRPMRARLLAGCATRPDARLAGADAALLVEVIEHLPLDQLASLPEHLFGRLRPGLLVVTTPNSEFNACFGPRFPGLRHHDHKFEWTRAQFQAWSSSIASRYGYAVRFSGVGDPPAGLEMIGHCSQIAVFTLQSVSDNPGRHLADNNGTFCGAVNYNGISCNGPNINGSSGVVNSITSASGDVTNNNRTSGDVSSVKDANSASSGTVPNLPYTTDEPYRQVLDFEFPWQPELPRDERLAQEAVHCARTSLQFERRRRNLAEFSDRDDGSGDDSCGDEVRLPLSRLCGYAVLKSLQASLAEVADALAAAGFRLSDDRQFLTGLPGDSDSDESVEENVENAAEAGDNLEAGQDDDDGGAALTWPWWDRAGTDSGAK